MEKKIISIDISPQTQAETSQNAGVMWEHNATTLVFIIDEKYVGDYKYYLEYRSLIGTKVRTEYLQLDTENKTITYDIPITMSSLRGVECFFNIVSNAIFNDVFININYNIFFNAIICNKFSI
jgi:hypothetical protein